MKRALPISLALFVAGVVPYLISRVERTPPVRPSSVVTEPSPPPSAPAAAPDDPLAVLDRHIASHRARAESTHSWIEWEHVALYSIDRARRTGSFEDWRQADEALVRAFEDGRGVGPYLARATLNASMHRIDRVETDLDAASRAMLVSASDRLAIASLRADVHYYAGDYAGARPLYEEQARASRRAPDALVAMAQLDWHTGHFDAAAAALDEAVAHEQCTRSPALHAWVLSARALMERDRGRLDDALSAIRTARVLTPDDAHLDQIFGEILEAQESADAALEVYERIAARTRSPQAMDGAARMLRARGDEIAVRELVETARQSYDAQLALFPEAAAGHAIDHWLRLEPDDVDRMIEIAELNAEARPYGETRLRLAMAYLLAGRIADARAVIDAVRTTEWRTAELFVLDAIVRRREGADDAEATSEAEEIAPDVMARYE